MTVVEDKIYMRLHFETHELNARKFKQEMRIHLTTISCTEHMGKRIMNVIECVIKNTEST